MKQILLLCGAGMSSGFLAQNIRKAAKKQKVAIKINAVSQSDAESYLNKSNMLLVAPHLSYLLEYFGERTSSLDIPMLLIPEDIYGTLDGERLLEVILEELKDKGEVK